MKNDNTLSEEGIDTDKGIVGSILKVCYRILYQKLKI